MAAARVLDSDTSITEIDIDTAITEIDIDTAIAEIDIDTAIAEIDIDVLDDVLGRSRRRDRPIQIVGVGPVAQGVGPNRVDADAQCCRDRCRGVGLGVRESS